MFPQVFWKLVVLQPQLYDKFKESCVFRDQLSIFGEDLRIKAAFSSFLHPRRKPDIHFTVFAHP